MKCPLLWCPISHTCLYISTSFFSGGSPEPFTLDQFTIDPFPILVQTGALVTIGAQVSLKEAINVGAKVSFNVVLNPDGLIPLTIPCVDLSEWGYEGNLGSW